MTGKKGEAFVQKAEDNLISPLKSRVGGARIQKKNKSKAGAGPLGTGFSGRGLWEDRAGPSPLNPRKEHDNQKKGKSSASLGLEKAALVIWMFMSEQSKTW